MCLSQKYHLIADKSRVRVMVFNATINNNSAIFWQSVLLVEEVTDKLYHMMLYRVRKRIVLDNLSCNGTHRTQ